MHNIHDTGYRSERGIRGIKALGILEPLPAEDLGPKKMRLAKVHIDWQVFYNCLGLCMFMPYSRAEIRDIVQAVTGWNSSIYELMKVGERALAMARAFNYREGFTAQDDVAHWRFSIPFESGPTEGRQVLAEEFGDALELYYEMRGWDKRTGAPTAGKLHELGMGWIAELLYGS
jgi:aldehyde:ferredoxin oxidoreductase